MNTYLIALGSNLGDRKYYIECARAAIQSQCGKVLAMAKILESEPIGAADQAFFNTVLMCESILEPEALLTQLLKIETDLGRVRMEHWGNRTIDCDIILWKDKVRDYPVYRSESLIIPHPEALKRAFVLAPAAEIAGTWVHPEAHATLAELWKKFG
ncbi:MAG: 2-amino-4-hydroxy-6-hydroxymethyldihydropteridine diphosphokinase [Chitinophagaceae bacterium]|nr:2-amino-4-hydroxy-6-hydroxymethyldihydropteridine diphosphokinase [Oligoflexus sp.]